MEFNQGFDEAGIRIEHHFGRGFYVKECNIPSGVILEQHQHSYDHLSWLSSGTVLVSVDGEEIMECGPKMLTIPAGKKHFVRAVSDVVWLCMHATDETDAARIDRSLIGAS